MFLLVKFIVLVTIFPNFAFSTDYCEEDLCGDGQKHIICDNSGDFQAECPSGAAQVDIEKYQDKIIKLSNFYRGKVARGEEGFKPAARMPRVQWHGVLADLAGLNVKKCDFERDCHNTEEFRSSGQNLRLTESNNDHKDPEDVIVEALEAWFDAKKYTTQDILDNFQETGDKSYIFTQMVQDKTKYMGCALARYTTSDDIKTSLFTCDYSTSNVIGEPVYETSDEACSKCITECTNGLCSKEEDISVTKKDGPSRNTCPALRK